MSVVVAAESAMTSDARTDLTHVACDCSPDTALCGVNVSDCEWTDGEAGCVVCADLQYVPCPQCGW